MSKYQFQESDIYLPGTDIPKNRLGITEAALQQQAYQIFIAELQPDTRLFFDLIALYNGYGPVDYSQTLGEAAYETNGYIQAFIACVRAADNSMLQQIILDGLNKAGVQ